MSIARKRKVSITKDFAYVCKRAKSSLPAFYYIFLADEQKWKQPAQFHYQISDILLREQDNFAIEAFRESGKTTLVMQTFPLYSLFFPAVERQYIVLIKQNQRLASKALKEIAALHKSNPLLFHNVKKVVEQSAEAYEVELADWEGCRVRIEAYGKGTAIRGLLWQGNRPDIIIIDDPQDLEDSLSPTVLDKDWEWFLSDVKPLSKDGRIFVIGNNLGEKCLIERIFEHAEELGFKTMRIPAIDENGRPTWGNQFPLAFLAKEKESYRKAGKLDIWYRERMCQAIASENQVFRREWFKFYSPNDVPYLLRTCSIYIACDLAISEKESADYTAFVVVGVSPKNDWYVLDCVYGRFNPSEAIDKLFCLVKRYKPVVVGIEKVAYQAAFAHFLEKEMPRRNIFFNIEPLRANKQKEIRIAALAPRFKAGTIYFPDIADWLPELETELLTFPRGKHDDLCDALAYIEHIAQPPAQTSNQESFVEIPRFTAV